MFERFTEEARQAVVLAQSETRALGHRHIGTEHLLLGLMRVERSIAALALASLDVTLDRARPEVEQIVAEVAGEPTDASADVSMPFTPRAKKVLELALREALALGHNFIGTEHILLGLAREEGALAMRTLAFLGVDVETLRNATLGRIPKERRRGGWMVREAQRTRWDYRVERPPDDGLAEWLNSHGADGWELVQTFDKLGGVFIFKRRR
jgi:ATP-dependent Clp protease ATP-binding subunit ClpC